MVLSRRVSSQVYVGRSAELAAIRAATQAPESRFVLVAGEAGIGKSRLVAEACAQARTDGMIALVGGCVRLGEVSLAYAPLVQALRELRDDLGEQAFSELAGAGTDLGALLGGDGGAAASRSAFLFEQLLGLLSRLGRQQPVLFVYEDLHWADASTRDLLAFLGRNLRDPAVTHVLTYRADELHRGHPLRELLADLERDPRVERLQLRGLDRLQLADLLSGIGAAPQSTQTVEQLLARTGGNPFYVEELVAAAGGDPSAGLPDALSEVIMARVARLPDDVQDVLERASALGSVIDEDVLAAVCGLPAREVGTALREALNQQLIVADRDGVRFRHALVREALYEHLLPGERERLHLAAAEVLEARPPSDGRAAYVRWALLAHHWNAAGETSRAFNALVWAGVEGVGVHALADAGGYFERALELWDRVPDPEATAEMDKAELLLRAGEAKHFSSWSPRGMELVKAAYEALPEDATPERRAVVLERVGQITWAQQYGKEAAAAYEEAAMLVANRPQSRDQAFVLAALGQSLMLRGRNAEAEKILLDAVQIADAVGAHRVAGHALCSLGPAQAELGRATEGIEALRRSLPIAREHGTTEDVVRVYANLTQVLGYAGEYDEAERIGLEGIRISGETGHREHYGEAIAGDVVAALSCTDRWADAERVYADLAGRLDVIGPYLELRWLRLLLCTGRMDEAEPMAQRALERTSESDDVQFRAHALIRVAEVAAARQRWDEARALFTEALAAAEDSDEQYYAGYGIGVAMAVEADRADSVFGGGQRAADELAQAQATADLLAERARALRARVGDDLTGLLPEVQGWLAMADADHARAHGRDTADGWAAVAATWDAVSAVYPAALARLREADAALRRDNDRPRAATVAARALQVAQRLGAEPLIAELQRLGQRGRLALRPAAAEPAAAAGPQQLGITRRESEVLGLLAVGSTNRQIAEQLFISEKTASVHVTNLLRKLGVPNRVEAAAAAQRLGYHAGSG